MITTAITNDNSKNNTMVVDNNEYNIVNEWRSEQNALFSFRCFYWLFGELQMEDMFVVIAIN